MLKKNTTNKQKKHIPILKPHSPVPSIPLFNIDTYKKPGKKKQRRQSRKALFD